MWGHWNSRTWFLPVQVSQAWKPARTRTHGSSRTALAHTKRLPSLPSLPSTIHCQFGALRGPRPVTAGWVLFQMVQLPVRSQTTADSTHAMHAWHRSYTSYTCRSLLMWPSTEHTKSQSQRKRPGPEMLPTWKPAKVQNPASWQLDLSGLQVSDTKKPLKKM